MTGVGGRQRRERRRIRRHFSSHSLTFASLSPQIALSRPQNCFYVIGAQPANVHPCSYTTIKTVWAVKVGSGVDTPITGTVWCPGAGFDIFNCNTVTACPADVLIHFSTLHFSGIGSPLGFGVLSCHMYPITWTKAMPWLSTGVEYNEYLRTWIQGHFTASMVW